MPQEIPQYLDPHNPLLASGPARLDAGTIELPGVGRLGVLTVRTPSTTVTVMLSAEDVATWTDLLAKVRDDLGGKKLVAATPMEVAALDTTMKRSNT